MARQVGLASVTNRRAVDDPVVIGLARIEPRGTKLRLVRRIGKDLRFEAQCVAHAIKRSAIHRPELACRDQRIVDRSVAIRRDCQVLIEDRNAGRRPGKVEIGMIGEIDDSRRIGDGLVIDRQFIVSRDRIGRADRKRAGKAIFAIRA